MSSKLQPAKLQPIRGTHDIFGEEIRQHNHIINTARRVSEYAGYSEASPPIFEFSEIFHRTLGETSDVVSKETYSFVDRGGDSITLRPEFTASIVRLFISNGLTQSLPFKAFYAGPAFRYERPQKGRLRQFHQVGVEWLGADSALADVESIACAAQFLDELGLLAHSKLEINTLGDSQSREQYRRKLVEYLQEHKNNLSEESKMRLERNPLRILDSKQEQDKKIIENAPNMQDSFTDIAKNWFAKLQEGLEKAKISYMVSPRLVRGLDYYTHTVFEFTTEKLGSQSTILAGGRYDGLVALMGGPEISGIGWAAGVERLSLLINEIGGKTAEVKKPIAAIALLEAADLPLLEIVCALRRQGIVVETIASRNVGKALKKADKMGVEQVLLLGEDELSNQTITVKNLLSGIQENIEVKQLLTQGL